MGSGYRTFTAGEVLTASNVQNYLQDQAVMVFGGSAARSSAIGTANFEEGMVSYLTDTDKVEAYNGTNWVQVGASTQGLTLINTTSFSGVSSQSISDVFSATYKNYLINTDIKTDQFRTVNMRFRVAGSDNSTANYTYQTLFASGTSVTGTRSTGQTSFIYSYLDGEGPVGVITQIFNPFASERTVIMTKSNSFSQAVIENANFTGVFTATTSFTGFSLLPSAGTMTGTVRVYGYNE